MNGGLKRNSFNALEPKMQLLFLPKSNVGIHTHTESTHSTETAYISSFCGKCASIQVTRCHRNCLYVVSKIHRCYLHFDKQFLWKMIYLYRETVSTDTPYKSVVARLDIIVSVTRFISCFCVICLSTLVEQFPLELVINYNLSKYYYYLCHRYCLLI